MSIKQNLLLFLLFSLWGLAFGQNSKTILEFRWGQADNEIGLFDYPEAEKVGPLSFCISPSGVLLLDSINKRVIKADRNGKVTTLAKNVEGWQITSDGGAGFYVLEMDQIKYFDGNGSKEKIYQVPPGIHLIEGYGTELNTTANGLILKNVDQKNALVERTPRVKAVRPDTLTFFIKRLSSNDVRILGADADNKILKSINVDLDGDRTGAVIFKGQDLNGNVYVEVERLKNNQADLEVHCYSLSGERLAKIELNNDYYTTVYKKTEVTADGAVYHLLTTKAGVTITRYGKEEAK